MNLLDTIVAHKKEEVARLKRSGSLHEHLDHGVIQPRDFDGALRNSGLSFICEIKRRSPSRGAIRPELSPESVGQSYEQGGASAISVLTDERFFGGSIDDVRDMRSAVSLPILRKEFIVDEYQIHESRAIGVDALLLITRILDGAQLADLIAASNECGLAALVEVHSEQEIEHALEAGAAILGINNRDLDTLEVDLQTGLRLRGYVPDDRAVVAESGVLSRDDAAAVEQAGFDGVLIGESLLLADDPVAKLLELRGVAS